jgi:hypothetical protein
VDAGDVPCVCERGRRDGVEGGLTVPATVIATPMITTEVSADEP